MEAATAETVILLEGTVLPAMVLILPTIAEVTVVVPISILIPDAGDNGRSEKQPQNIRFRGCF